MLRRLGLHLLVLVGCGTASGAGTSRPVYLPRRPPQPVADDCEENAIVDSGPPAVSGRECVWQGGARPQHLSEIRCASDFEMLSAALPSSVFAGTRALKFVIDTEDGDRLYFVNSYEFDL